MGKGDRKSAKGKRFRKSYGVKRQRSKAAPVVEAKKEEAPKPKTAAKKTTAKKTTAKKTTAEKAPAKKAAKAAE